MRLQALSIALLLLQGAALARSRSPISARRPADDNGVDGSDDDDGSLPSPDANAITPAGLRVLLASPNTRGNASLIFNTCDPVYLWWFYDPTFASQLNDEFNLTITNVGVDQNPPPPQTTTSTTASISSESSIGTLPTSVTKILPTATIPTQPPSPTTAPAPVRLSRRADVTLQLLHNQSIVVANHFFLWPAITVPSGYYILTGVSTTGSTTIQYENSSPFHIGAGSTACFTSASGGGTSQVPSGNDAAQTAGPSPVGGASGSNKTGIIAGAVVGSLLGLLAVAGLFFLFALRRRQQSTAPRGGAAAWGQVGSNDSRPPTRSIGLPIGTANRLSRHADAALRDADADSIEEKYMAGVSRTGSASTGHSAAFSPEPPVFRRHSQVTNQSYPLGMLSTRDSRRSTIQSIPTTVTPNATPIPSPSPVPAPGAVLSRSTSAAGNGPKKTPRKPVPVYDPAEISRETLTGGGSTPPKRSSTDVGDDADLGAQMMSSSQRTEASLLSSFPFELEGAGGQVHYLIPDPPASPRR